MTRCQFDDSPDVELYFYGELDAEGRARIQAHARGCEACRKRLEDLHAIRQALATQPVVDAPPAGDWSGFMKRLDSAVDLGSVAKARSGEAPPKLRSSGGGTRFGFREIVPIAAMLAVVTFGLYVARTVNPPQPAQQATSLEQTRPAEPPVTERADAKPVVRALRENSAEHLERSKLVVLGLATKDARHTAAGDWQYERQLAGTLLSDTRLYRLAAQERGVPDVARVMRDLETVLLEASMSENADRDTLARVQRLIAKRDLVAKIQTVAATGAAGL